jgi:hypothetical protein
MTRRELFTKFAGAVAGTGVVVPNMVEALQLHDPPTDPSRALAVMTFDQHLSEEAFRNVNLAWRTTVRGTVWERVRLLVLHQGVSFELRSI